MTDDLKYLIKPIWDLEDPTANFTFCDQACCYNIDTDELQTISIRNGTNRTWIVAAESINGRPQFLAFWDPVRPASGGTAYKRLGVFDQKSSLISQIAAAPMDSTDFFRTGVWDYAHTKVFFYENRFLTEYDYGKNTVKRFPLDPGKLKVP